MANFGKKRIFIIAAGVALVLTAGFFIYKAKINSAGAWVALKKGPIVEAIYGLSTVTSEREFKVKPGVTTMIQKVWAKEGDAVKKGQPLIQLVDQPVIRAPFDGTVTSIPFKEGENVFPQIAILSLLDLENLYLSMSVEQSAALQVRKDQEAVLTFESQRNQKYKSKVVAVIPKDGQFEVHLKVDDLPKGILPGMTADTSVVVGKKDDAVLIPLKAVQAFQVKFREDGKSTKKTVKLGIVGEEWGELLEPVFSNPSQIEVVVP